jgi:hypothetical protein
MGEIENLHVPERLSGETFEAYQERRYISRVRNKMNAKGYMLWNSKEQGQYVASEHLSDVMKTLIEKDFEESVA